MTLTPTTLGAISIDGRGSYGVAASAVPRNIDLPTYLRITDITDDGRLNTNGLMSVDVDDDDIPKYLLKTNDIVFARTGASTGRSYFYDGSVGELVFAGFLIRFSLDPQKVFPRFIKYYCLSDRYRAWVAGHSVGSTRGNCNASGFASLPIFLPPLPIQRKIAEILGAYDDLIENNRRRIALLEKMAREVYRERFVRRAGKLQQVRLGSLIDVCYGKDHKALADGEIPVYGSGGVMRYADRPLYSGEAVLIPRKGTLNNIMYVNGDFWTVDTMFYAKPKRENIAPFVYYYLSSIDMSLLNSGTAVPSMTTEVLNSMSVGVPPAGELESFAETFSLMFNEKAALVSQNRNLARQRDRLLPRLLSGRLEVRG